MTYTQAARSTEEFHMACHLGQGLVLRICSLFYLLCDALLDDDVSSDDGSGIRPQTSDRC